MCAASWHASGILLDAINAGSLWSQLFMKIWFLLPRDTIRSISMQCMMFCLQPFVWSWIPFAVTFLSILRILICLHGCQLCLSNGTTLTWQLRNFMMPLQSDIRSPFCFPLIVMAVGSFFGSFLNQARTSLLSVRTRFHKIDPVQIVSMCVCVRPSGY